MASNSKSKSKVKNGKVKEQVLLCWTFPPHGWYKLNVDGTYRSGSTFIAGGGVIRNHDGEWLSGFAENLGTATSRHGKVIEAEVSALYRGLELALNAGWTPLEVETDSTTVVKLVFDPVEVNQKHPQLVELVNMCRKLLYQSGVTVILSHVYRQQNNVADFLADFGLSLAPGCHIFEVPPPSCQPVLLQDLCKVAQPRSLPPSAIGNRRIKKLEEADIQTGDLAFMMFRWKIDSVSKLNTTKCYSNVFVVGVFEWRILVYPRGNKVDYLSVYLDVTGSSTLPKGWAKHARFSLTVVNQLHSINSITKDTEHVFTKNDNISGISSFVPLSEFYDHRKGYVVNDTCIIEAKVAVHKSELKILEDQRTQSSAPMETSDQKHDEPGPSNLIL